MVTAAEAGHGSGQYVGYPMAFWCEFKPEYGFHQGYVWPVPRSHGCLRLHHNVAPKFFALVHVGTPVDIAQTQPEDATIGANVQRPTDYNDPDPGAVLHGVVGGVRLAARRGADPVLTGAGSITGAVRGRLATRWSLSP